MPKVSNELPAGDSPQMDEDPFLCLLEDDNLITGISLKTHQLFEPVQNRSEALLLIHVQIKRTRGTQENLALG
jgi:hypothetical protein